MGLALGMAAVPTWGETSAQAAPMPTASVSASQPHMGEMAGMDHSSMDGMNDSSMPGMDHSSPAGMDDSSMPGMDHSHGTTAGQSMPAGGSDHTSADHNSMPGMTHDSAEPTEPVAGVRQVTLAGFGAVNAVVVGAAWLLRRRSAADRARRTAVRTAGSVRR